MPKDYELKIGFQNCREHKGCSGKTKVLQKIIPASSLQVAKTKATRILKEVLKTDKQMGKYRSIGWGGWCKPIEYEQNCYFTNRASDSVGVSASVLPKDFKSEDDHPGTFAVCQLTWDERQQNMFEEEN